MIVGDKCLELLNLVSKGKAHALMRRVGFEPSLYW